MELLKILLSILLPPLGVFLRVGLGVQFWVNVALTIFGFYILGLVHAVYIIAKEPHPMTAGN
ncbi:YqaE/Pmp3 family membrane protein [Mariniblastus sp.]|nr:YqaE/Pmp3 family membrane protein [Mariniblastus sp.]